VKKFSSLIAALFIVSLVGCSTVMNGTSQLVSINSDVTEADVMVNGVSVGKTPFSGKIKRSNKTEIKVSKTGYETVVITPETSLPVAFWGNIIIGGLLGSTTDGVSGAVYEYKPNTFYVNLKKN